MIRAIDVQMGMSSCQHRIRQLETSKPIKKNERGVCRTKYVRISIEVGLCLRLTRRLSANFIPCSRTRVFVIVFTSF